MKELRPTFGTNTSKEPFKKTFLNKVTFLNKMHPLTFLFVENRENNFEQNKKLSIWEDFLVMRFDQKNEVNTISNVQKCMRKGGLFAQLWRI